MQEKRFARMFAILGQLSPHSQVMIRDLACEHEVSKKTIQRDIDALMSAKLGVYYDEDRIRISRIGYGKILSWMSG